MERDLQVKHEFAPYDFDRRYNLPAPEVYALPRAMGPGPLVQGLVQGPQGLQVAPGPQPLGVTPMMQLQLTLSHAATPNHNPNGPHQPPIQVPHGVVPYPMSVPDMYYRPQPNADYESPYERPRARLAHNLIEQRYRNKINDKFTLLQNSVPTLRAAARRKDDSDSSALEDLEGLEPARKLNKGTILTKSIEYIKFLERKEARLKLEYEELAARARVMGVSLEK